MTARGRAGVEPSRHRSDAARDDAISEASRRSIEAGSKSFAAAARLFDPETRDSARLFYAWCRHCDDVIDGQVAGLKRTEFAGTPLERLAGLERRTREALAGVPQDEPAFAAFARVASKHRIPASLALDILAGFRMDVEEVVYATVDDLLGYCYGVAGAVGVSMAIIMGVAPDQRDTLDRACDLGLAFQLTNIARDVMDDARSGRVYLPADLFGGERLTPEDVLDGSRRPAVIAATHALLELAERYYASARGGIALLPWRSAWAVATALGVYREIGRLVRGSPDPWVERLSVPGWRKAWHVVLGGIRPGFYRALGPRPRLGLWTRPAPAGARRGAATPRNSSPARAVPWSDGHGPATKREASVMAYDDLEPGPRGDAMRSVTAFFDTQDAADKARQDLVAGGISADDIRIAGGEAESAEPAHPHGFWESLKEFFMPDEDRHLYAEGLRRGGFAVSVRASGEIYEQALDILDRDGAVDMEERASGWRDEGWGPTSAFSGAVGPAGGGAPLVDERAILRPGNDTAGFGASHADEPMFDDGPASIEREAGQVTPLAADEMRMRTAGTPDAAYRAGAPGLASPADTARDTTARPGEMALDPTLSSPSRAPVRDDRHGRTRVRSYFGDPALGETSDTAPVRGEAPNKPL